MSSTEIALASPPDKVIGIDDMVGEFAYTRTDNIRISKTNRTRFDMEALKKLAENIREIGIVQPILIRPVTPTAEEPQEFEVVAGERRWRGAVMVDLAIMPTMKRILTDIQAREIQLTENLQREDPHPMEEAEGFQELMLQSGYTADQLADKFKTSKSQIYARLKLCALTTDVREQFLENKISPSTALLIARVPVPALQIKALAEISRPQGELKEAMSYRMAARHIQDRYMMDLTRAKFALTDASIIPDAGACSKCVKKTGNQPEIYADIKSADVCTDPDCYAEKREANDARTIAEANQGGIPVYDGDEGVKRLRVNTHNRYSEFVCHPAPLWQFERNHPSTKNEGNTADHLDAAWLPEISFYAKQEDGEVVAFYPRQFMQKLLEDGGVCETVEEHEKRMAEVREKAKQTEDKRVAALSPVDTEKLEKRRQEEAAAEKAEADDEAYRIELYKQLRHRGASGFSLGSLRVFVKLALVNRDLPDTALAGVYTFDTSTTENIHAYIDQAPEVEIQLLLVDILLGECLASDGYYDKDDYEHELVAIHEMARHEGIDPDEVKASLQAAASEPTTPASNADEAPAAESTEMTAAMVFAQARANPEGINDLYKIIINEHPHLLSILEISARQVGYVYGVGGFAKCAVEAAPADDSNTQESQQAQTAANIEPVADTPLIEADYAADLAAHGITVITEESPAEASAAALGAVPAPTVKTPSARKLKAAIGPKGKPWPWPTSKPSTEPSAPIPAQPIIDNTEG